MTFFICEYKDYYFSRKNGKMKYKKIFKGHTLGHERVSLNGEKFIARGDKKDMTWLKGYEPEFTHAEILEELKGPEWFDPEAVLHT